MLHLKIVSVFLDFSPPSGRRVNKFCAAVFFATFEGQNTFFMDRIQLLDAMIASNKWTKTVRMNAQKEREYYFLSVPGAHHTGQFTITIPQDEKHQFDLTKVWTVRALVHGLLYETYFYPFAFYTIPTAKKEAATCAAFVRWLKVLVQDPNKILEYEK